MNKAYSLMAVLLILLFAECRKDKTVVTPEPSSQSTAIDTAALMQNIGGQRYWTGYTYSWSNGMGTTTYINDTFAIIPTGNNRVVAQSDTLPFSSIDTVIKMIRYERTEPGYPTSIHIEVQYYYDADSIWYKYNTQTGLGGSWAMVLQTL